MHGYYHRPPRASSRSTHILSRSFFFTSRRRHTRFDCDWSSDVCSSDLSATSARAAVKADINVTPLIDVMLVLLIIFMIVTPLIAAGFQATIPRSSNPENRPEGQDEVKLGIDKDSKFWLDLGSGPRQIPDDQLPERLAAVYANRTKDKQQQSSQIVLELKADGSYAINGQPYSVNQLDQAFHQIYDPRPAKLLFIKAAPNRKYLDVMQAMDIAHGAGVQVIGFTPPEQAKK